MSAKGYTTEVKVETFLNEAIESGKVDDAILQAERFIDEYTGRNFKADTTATARKYDGDGSQELIIDDCVDVTKVEVGSNYYGDSYTEIVAHDSVGAGTDVYYELPNNYSAKNLPIRKLLLRARHFCEGLQNHQITGKWGYSVSVPSDVELAATILVASVYKYGRSGGLGGVKSEKIGDYSVSFNDDQSKADFERAMEILDRYKKFEI